MINYTDTSAFVDEVELMGTTDPVMGGMSGELNIPIKQLADRTRFLYNLNGKFEDIKIISATTGSQSSTLLRADSFRKLVEIYFTNNVNYTLTLPALSGYNVGDIINLRAYSPGSALNNARIIPGGGDTMMDNNGTITQFWLYTGESTVLVKYSSTVWKMIAFEGNHYNVGDDMMAYRQKKGSIIRNGSALNRSEYPRLWAWVQQFPNTQLLSDAVWNAPADPLIPTRIQPNRSMWSTGNGTTTFRVPDDRGLFERALSLSSGNDPDREAAGIDTYPGGRQEAYGGNALQFGGGGAPVPYEPRPRNVGKLPLLIY